MDEERLIVEVENHKILYDASHPYYKDTERKEKAWAEIARVLGVFLALGRGLSAEKQSRAQEKSVQWALTRAHKSGAERGAALRSEARDVELRRKSVAGVLVVRRPRDSRARDRRRSGLSKTFVWTSTHVRERARVSKSVHVADQPVAHVFISYILC